MTRPHWFTCSSPLFAVVFFTLASSTLRAQDSAVYFNQEKFPELKTGAVYTYTGTWDGELAYRAKPSEEAAKLTYTLKTGSPITVLGFKGTFALIQFDDKKGYIPAALLEHIAHPQGDSSKYDLKIFLKNFTSPWNWKYWAGLIISGILGFLSFTKYNRLEAYFHQREKMEFTKFLRPWFLYITLLCGVLLALLYLMAPVVIVDFLGRDFTLLPTTSSSLTNFIASIFLVIALCFAGAAVQSVMKYKIGTGLIRTAAQWLSMVFLLAFSLYLCSFVLWIFGILMIYNLYKMGFQGTAAYFENKCPNCGHYGGMHTDSCMNRNVKR